MLLESNSLKVYNIIKYYDDLKNIDKVRLAIHILENKEYLTDYNIDNIIKTLQQVLVILDPGYNNTITNFSKYKNLMILLAKNMDLDYNDKKRLSVELLFNIYETDFNDEINQYIRDNLTIYEFCYALLNN